jgi:hypothetical protein
MKRAHFNYHTEVEIASKRYTCGPNWGLKYGCFKLLWISMMNKLETYVTIIFYRILYYTGE